MYETNKVRLSMFGVEYVVNTSEEPGYVKKLAGEIENSVQSALDRNNSTSLSEAYMLCCLNFADRYKKAEQNADHLRSQVTEYLEDSSRTRMELEQAKREIERLTRELSLK